MGGTSASHDQVQYGLAYARVTNNHDEEKLGRVKVQLPWLDGGDTDESTWAQLLTPMEGNKFGWFNLPEIGDVVMVMFVEGDLTQPVIVGGVWSTPDHPPEPNEDGKNNFRGYRSRAGHRLIFDDSAKTKVVLADKTGKNMFGVGNFDQDGAGPNVCAVHKPPMSGTEGVSFSSVEGTLEVTCANGTLKIEAGKSIKISSKTKIGIKAGSSIELKSGSAAKITSSSPNSFDAPVIKIN